MEYIGITLLWICYYHSTQACCPTWATGSSYNPHTGKCHKVSNDKESWAASRSACRNLGAVLGIVDTVNDTNFVRGLRGGDIWMGINDLETEGVFTHNGKNITVELWKDGQPNGDIYDDGQDCVIIDSNKEWQDKHCDKPYHFLCEWPVVKDESSENYHA
ncbi:hypothetical protein LOTGIDRAFT_169457 [Lottia gigantea]|uniref:C-type lectin domain-containing protein n=1 Tax=Lottia gigantea TaxID=225164 RepID=V3ZR89_LOTGI|nr:hypothetical protein LOTGIDRAFT_169457 [Lottia gigantea]ESO83386.1 hypothetical protein LOTGIDRAFT_169457 [Lottia gigantea]